ncbi:predicted protein [Thalassiosira pseudonana CCMP1335]|uniref:Fucosyltransferase n=1 Tax=Thalassiosira pseudonana TaxID=35128 RepID=B5YP56_THAPS|nr:predicted protein [Thalassiosira pseudonana CCMP1335]ACI64399.1 predicted protein [Thalassiosira pseudonana CCMP1335]
MASPLPRTQRMKLRDKLKIFLLIVVVYSIVVVSTITIKLKVGDSPSNHQDAPITTVGYRGEKITSEDPFSLTNAFGNNERPYLVVCIKIDDALLPISPYFTLVRLFDDFGDIPPWNATVLLQNEDNLCANHPYVVESKARRDRASFLAQSDIPADMKGQWKHGVHWPDAATDTMSLRVIHNRPAIIGVRGGVFWRNSYKSCEEYDFVVDRQKEVPGDGCFTIHFVQGASGGAWREIRKRERKDVLGLNETTNVYEKQVAHPNKPVDDVHYDNFCSLLIRFDSNNLVDMFKDKNYDIDAIVRHMFFRQLSEYKPCQRVKDCPGNPYTSYECMVGYKFHITMDNSLVDGYVSEKVFNGALGGGIPIYFGATDVGSYVNIKSIIHCDVSREVIEEMRSFYPRKGKPRRFAFEFNKANGLWPADEELLNWADGYLRSHLEPCVKRVIELDTNDTAFREVLDEPFITDHGIMSGEYPLRGVASAYNLLRKWEGDSLASDGSLSLDPSSVSSLNASYDRPDRAVRDSSVLYNQLVSKTQQTCSNGLADDTNLSTYLGLSQEGSNVNEPFVDVLLPPDQYPILHRSCFFIPTKPENIDEHKHLLTLYPNSFLFVSVQDHPRIDSEAKVIYISGVDSYELLWKKTLGLWDIVSFESSNLFKECEWFFKVDTDTFLNLHVIEQFLSIYNTSEPHYTGWYNVGGLGRKAHGKQVKIAIGAFYGVTREVMMRWKDWRSDGRHVWGSFHSGEDSQMAFFLREHGTCLEIPIRNLAKFKQNYVWGGFDDIGSPMNCREKIKWLSDNPCFAYAHKVPMEWMGPLTGVLASQIVNNATCSLIDKGIVIHA